MFQQSKNITDHRVDVHGRALGAGRAALPREIQEAVDDLRRPERLPLDLLQKTRAGVFRIRALEQHLREARDAGQRRVHLVGHAGRQQPERGHLL